jgi:integrase
MKIKGIYHMPGSRFYWYRWTQDGKRHAVSLRTDDLSEAIKKVNEIQAGAWFARWERGEKVATPITQVVEKYLNEAQKRRKKPMRPATAKRVKNALLQFTTDRGIRGVGDIDHYSISEWIDGLEKAGRSDDTLYTYASTLKTFVRYLVDHKLLQGEVITRFDVPRRGAIGRKNWLKKREVEKIIAEAENDALRFILFAGFHAGLRRNEICNAKVGWFDLDREPGLIHVQNDPASGFILKDRENRTVPVTDSFKEFLHGFLKGKIAGAYVLHPNKSAAGKWMYRYDFSRTWKTHMRRCGVRCTIHDARRSFASNLVSEGESIYIVAGWLGDGVQVVERSYGHLAPSAGNINRLTARVA